jgi:hypothetical protein
LVKATQFKGDSETHSDLSPDDEFANFEQFDFYLQAYPQGLGYKIQKGDTVRSALKSGLELDNAISVNPFKFGLIGSMDSHAGMPSAEAPNFWGKTANCAISVNKRNDDPYGYRDGKESMNGWNMSVGGLAAVWRSDNSR